LQAGTRGLFEVCRCFLPLLRWIHGAEEKSSNLVNNTVMLL